MSAAYKITTQSFDPLGTRGTRKDNELTPEVGLWFATSAFTPTPAELATEAFINAAIKAESLMPLSGMDGYDLRDMEDKIYDSNSGNQKFLKRGKERKTYKLDIPLAVHQALQSFNNADLRVYKIHDDGSISGTLANGKFLGFTTDMINVGRMPSVAADGGSPALTPLMINYANSREWDSFGTKLTPAIWEPLGKEGLTPVKLTIIGTPTATLVKVKVCSEDGLDSLGAVKEVLMGGIDSADFTFVKANDTAQSAFAVTEDLASRGTYNIVGTLFTTGKVNLKTPANMVSTDQLMKAPSTPTTVTIA